jgi:hypothetical protein
MIAFLLLLLLAVGSLTVAVSINRTRTSFSQVTTEMNSRQVEEIMGDDYDLLRFPEFPDEIALVWLNHDGFFVVYLKEDKVQRKHAGEEPPLTLRLKLLFYELTHGRKQRGVAFP